MRFGSTGGIDMQESNVRFKLRDKSRAERWKRQKGIIHETSDLQFSIQIPNSRLGLPKRHGQTLVKVSSVRRGSGYHAYDSQGCRNNEQLHVH